MLSCQHLPIKSLRHKKPQVQTLCLLSGCSVVTPQKGALGNSVCSILLTFFHHTDKEEYFGAF